MSRPLTTLMAVAIILFLAFLWREKRLGGFLGAILSPGEAPGSEPTGALMPKTPAAGSPLERLRAFAAHFGLTITSESEGKHNPGSLHYQGRAIDVRSRGLTEEFLDYLKGAAKDAGIKVRDERQRPPGQDVWGGPHIHLEIPALRGLTPYPNASLLGSMN